MSEPLARGAVVWVDFSPTVGREQRGTRPALAVSSAGYLDSVRDLVIVVPITSVDRGWPHHVPVRGEQTRLPQAGFAMIEQPRTSSVARICRRSGTARRLLARERWREPVPAGVALSPQEQLIATARAVALFRGSPRLAALAVGR